MKIGAEALALTLVGFVVALVGCTGDPGAAGSSCTVVANADMTSTIRCTDGTMVTVRNGGPGTAGASCTVRDGTTPGTKIIECDDGTMVTVADGDAASCTVTAGTTPGTEIIMCDDGTMATVTNGDPGRSCTVRNGTEAGTRIITCDDGTSVTVSDGASADNFRVTQFHGEDALLSSGEYAGGAKTLVHAVITAATADAAGVVTVDFRVETRDTPPVPVTNVASISATIAKLVPPAATEASNRWVPYIWRTETVSGSASGDWPNPDGTTAQQGSSESSSSTATPPPPLGTLTNNDDGTYRYVFVNHLGATMSGTTPITYERNLTHRVVVMMGGHSGPTADATFDFVPDGTAVMATRNIIETSTCQQCHGPNEFHGHGGNRLSIETCAVCHTEGTTDAQSGNSLDLKVMVHRIHAGGEMGLIPGPDGVLWDDPATTANEQADNVDYSIWGNRNNRHNWWKVGFPAVLDNCTKCHQGAGADVDSWQETPSRAACGSCHNDVNFATGANHAGGVRTDDSGCTVCHSTTTVAGYHDAGTNDPRNIPEFDVAITMSPPATGTFYTGSDAPVVSISLTDHVTHAAIDMATVREDDAAGHGGAEGCTLPTCGAGDGYFATANFFVHGPRGHRVPVLTTAARAQALSPSTLTWPLTLPAGSIAFTIDGGRDRVILNASGGDVNALAAFNVAVPAGTYTQAQLRDLLNADTNFARRAIASVQTIPIAGGLTADVLSVRSRNLAPTHALAMAAGPVHDAIFGAADGGVVHLPPGYYASNNVSARALSQNDDPKVIGRTATAIRYQLDPVQDLEPGTYTIMVELADRGYVNATNYRVPSDLRFTFQVGTATAERAPAANCSLCHQNSEDRGMIFHLTRVNAPLDATGVDFCGSCHDYQPQSATGTLYSGAIPISRRVHGVHNGRSLNYPNATVGHADEPVSRNWDIGFPQDVRNCETCHPGTEQVAAGFAATATSGSWQTKPARIPCMCCHDSDAATAHFRIMTFDPTPANAWSGDELESCQTCH